MGGGHFGRFHPYGDLSRNRVVCKRMDCYGCNWRCRYPAARCMEEIEVDDVWNELVALVQGAGTQARDHPALPTTTEAAKPLGGRGPGLLGSPRPQARHG